MAVKRERINLKEIEDLFFDDDYLDDFEYFGFDVIHEEITESDLDHQLNEGFTIVKRQSDGKFFKVLTCTDIDGVYITNDFAEEVFPQQKTITVYE